jgi:hypothetical protein
VSKLLALLLSLLMVSAAYAGDIPEPKPVADKNISDYLKKIQDNWQNWIPVTTSPNGNRIGRFGDVVVYDNAGILGWYMNTTTGPNTGTAWTQVGINAAGNPAGSNTELQFNNSGIFGASPNLTWVSPALTIGVAGSTTGQLKLTGSTSGTVTVSTQNTAGTWDFKLPADDGDANEFLQTDGNGNASWQPGAVIGGSDTYVQFNDGGNFGGDAGFRFSKTTNHISNGDSTLDQTVSRTVDGTSVSYVRQLINSTETITSPSNTPMGLYTKLIVNPSSNATNQYPVGIESSVVMDSSASSTYTGGRLTAGRFRAINENTAITVPYLSGIEVITGDVASAVTSTTVAAMLKTGSNQTLTGSMNRLGLYISQTKESEAPDFTDLAGRVGLVIGTNTTSQTQNDNLIRSANLISRGSTGTQVFKEAYNQFEGVTSFGANASSAGGPTGVVYIAALEATGIGTVSTSGTSVSGSGTKFDHAGKAHYYGNPVVGDILVHTSSERGRMITATSSQTAATIERGFPSDLGGGTSFKYAKPILLWNTLVGAHDNTLSGRYTGGAISAFGYLGIGTQAPVAPLEIYRYYKAGDEATVEMPKTIFGADTVLLASATQLSSWRHNRFDPPTLMGVAGGATESVTTASTVTITGAPISDTSGISSSYALEVASGAVLMAGPTTFKPSTIQGINEATDRILADATYVQVEAVFNLTLTSAPTIADSLVSGQIVYISGLNGAANSITVQDQDSLANSNLQLGASTRVIGSRDVLTLIFDGEDWCEVSYANN